MRALVLRNKQLSVKDIDRPVPGAGQVLVRVVASGICGSDLHVARFMDDMIEGTRLGRGGLGRYLDPDRDLVMGHEYVGEVLEVGPEVEGWEPGARVASVPVTTYNPDVPGAYAEYTLMQAQLLLPVPDGLPSEVAAMTEPCAVGLHAVRMARPVEGETVFVMGAGPVGLMTLLWLKKEGAARVIVSDPAGARRELAGRLGADELLDPTGKTLIDLVVAAAGDRPKLVFDCVGVEGTLEQAMEVTAPFGQVVVVGVCLREDRLHPLVGIDKQLNLQFVLGYTRPEFAEALESLGDGSIAAGPMVTRTIGIEEMPAAFEALGDPHDCKVVVTFPPSDA